MGASGGAWIHWSLFGACLLGVAAVLGAGSRDLVAAFEAGELTRQVLYQALVYLAGVLALLWGAGFIFANRPRPAVKPRFEGYTYA